MGMGKNDFIGGTRKIQKKVRKSHEKKILKLYILGVCSLQLSCTPKAQKKVEISIILGAITFVGPTRRGYEQILSVVQNGKNT